MSVQAGLLFPDCRPIDGHFLVALGEPLRASEPDVYHAISRDGLAMALAGFHVTAEDQCERQPYESARGHLLTWDGRLDNRADLSRQLGLRQQHLLADVVIVAAAYDEWGQAAFPRLRGDWSAALYDRDARTVTLASDYMGIRPLFYFCDATHSSWSTALDELAIRENRARRIDRDFVAGCLAVHTLPNRTPYEGIRSVPAGHCVTLLRGGDVYIKRFWNCPVRSIRYSSLDDYAEHLRAVFIDALQTRLRASDPVWCLLSGGLDSSSIVSAIDTLCPHEARVHARTLSFVTNGSPEADERPFIRAVEDAVDRSGTHLNAEDYTDLVDTDRAWIHPEYPKGVELFALMTLRQQRGRVVFSGVGGDLVLANHGCHMASVADSLSSGAVPRAIRETRAWSRAARKPFVELLLDALLHLVGSPRRDPVIAPLGRQLRLIRRHEYLSEELLAAVEAEWERLRNVRPANGVLPSTAYTYSVLSRYAGRRHARTPGDLPDIAYTFPYLDQALVEYVLSIPGNVLTRPGQPRALMRHAVGAMLPDAIRSRFSKGYAAPYLARLLRTKVGRLRTHLPRLEVVKRGYIKPQFLQRLIDGAGMQKETLSLLSAIVRTEEWLCHHGMRWQVPGVVPLVSSEVYPPRQTAAVHIATA